MRVKQICGAAINYETLLGNESQTERHYNKAQEQWAVNLCLSTPYPFFNLAGVLSSPGKELPWMWMKLVLDVYLP